MPRVGRKHFPYTSKGIADAKAEAASSGKKLDIPYKADKKHFKAPDSPKRTKVSYKTGGKVEMYQDQLRRKYHGK
jgi:hypothetical protein|tara:strand:+ start:182 stop:406 length:225 start_codon:yes stop_codon:yes gene_type:complete